MLVRKEDQEALLATQMWWWSILTEHVVIRSWISEDSPLVFPLFALRWCAKMAKNSLTVDCSCWGTWEGQVTGQFWELKEVCEDGTEQVMAARICRSWNRNEQQSCTMDLGQSWLGKGAGRIADDWVMFWSKPSLEISGASGKWGNELLGSKAANLVCQKEMEEIIWEGQKEW